MPTVTLDLTGYTTTAPTCVLWLGAITGSGYGNVVHEGKNYSPHTLVWEQTNGPIPEGMQVDHVCHDPKECPGGKNCPHRKCVNIDHLKLATPGRNSSPARRRKPERAFCSNGHPWKAGNIYRYKQYLKCRLCMIEAKARYRAKIKTM